VLFVYFILISYARMQNKFTRLSFSVIICLMQEAEVVYDITLNQRLSQKPQLLLHLLTVYPTRKITGMAV
jgi:hypothetical protein